MIQKQKTVKGENPTKKLIKSINFKNSALRTQQFNKDVFSHRHNLSLNILEILLVIAK